MKRTQKTKHALVASVVSMAMCCALLLGTTFAWFTDSVTNTGNKIEAGTLDIQLNDSNESGTALFSSDEAFKWEPGRSQMAPVKLSNVGSLWLKYKMSFTNVSTTGDADITNVLDVYKVPAKENGAEATVEDLTQENYLGTVKELMAGTIGQEGILAPDGEFGTVENQEIDSTDAFTLVIKMQESAGNEYQNTSVTFDIVANATQYTYETDGFGNKDYDADAEYDAIQVGGTTEALETALEAAQPGDTLQLAATTYALTDDLVIPSGVTLRGAQAGVPASEWVNDETAKKTIIAAPSSGDRILQILQSEGDQVTDVVLDGILVDGNEQDVKGIFVKKDAGDAMTGVAIRNCAVIDCANDGIDVSNTNGAVIENNYVKNVTDNGIRLGNYKNTDGAVAYVRNNVIDGVSATQNGAIMVTEGSGDVVVENNTIKNVGSYGGAGENAIDMGESAILVEKVYEGGVITVQNNILENVDQGISVYKFSPVSENDKVIICNNSIKNAHTFSVGTSTLNYYSKNIEALVEIDGNTFENTSGPQKGNIYIERINRYNENTTNWKVVAEGNTEGNGTYTPDSNP